MTPPKGHYRSILKDSYPDVRIAFTHTPIIGCTRVNSEPVLRVLDNSDDQYAKFYADGLRDGSLAAIVENNVNKERWGYGELFFKS